MEVDKVNEEASGGGIGSNESGDNNQFVNNQGGATQVEFGDNQGGALGDEGDDIKEEERKISGGNNSSRYSYLNYLQSLPSQFPSPNGGDEDGDINLDLSGNHQQVVEKNTTTLPPLESVSEGENTNNNNNNIMNNNNNNNDVPTSFIVPETAQYSVSNNNNKNDDNRELIDLCDSPPLEKKKILIIGGSSSATSPFMTGEEFKHDLLKRYPVWKYLSPEQQQLVINLLKINPDTDYIKLINDVVSSSTLSSKMKLQRQTFQNDDPDIKYMKTEINLISEPSTSSKQRKKNKDKEIAANLVNASSGNLLNDDDNNLTLPSHDHDHHHHQQHQQQRTQNLLNDDNQLPLPSHHHHHHQQQQEEQSDGYTEDEKDALFFEISGLERDRMLTGYDDLSEQFIDDENRNISSAQLKQRRYSVQMHYYLMYPDELKKDLKNGELVYDDYGLQQSEKSLYAEMKNHTYEYPELTIKDWNNIKKFILNRNPRKDDGEYLYQHEPWICYQQQLIVMKQLLFDESATYFDIFNVLKEAKSASQRKRNTNKGKEGRSKKRTSSSRTKRGSLTGLNSKSSSSFATPTSSTTSSLPIPFEDDKSAISQFIIASSKELEIKLKSPDSADPHCKRNWNDNGFPTAAALARGSIVGTPAALNDALHEIANAHLSFFDLIKTRLKRRIYWDVRIPILYTIQNAGDREKLFLKIRSDGIKRLSSIKRVAEDIEKLLEHSFRATSGALSTEWQRIDDWYDAEWKPTNRNCNTAGLDLLQQLGLFWDVDPSKYDYFIDDCLHSTICNRIRFHGTASQKHFVIVCDLHHPAKFTGQGGFAPSNSKGNNIWNTHLKQCNKKWQNESKQITLTTAKVNALCEFFEQIISQTAKNRESLAHSMTISDIKNIYDYIYDEDGDGFKVQFELLSKYVYTEELQKIDNEDKYRNSKIFKGMKSSKMKRLSVNMNINTEGDDDDDLKITEIITDGDDEDDDDDDDDIKILNNSQNQPQTKRKKLVSLPSTTDKREDDVDDDDDEKADINNNSFTMRQIPPLPHKATNPLQQQRNKRHHKQTKTKNKKKS